MTFQREPSGKETPEYWQREVRHRKAENARHRTNDGIDTEWDGSHIRVVQYITHDTSRYAGSMPATVTLRDIAATARTIARNVGFIA